jgi:branched-chain amino acid transport system ATP-binding protein
MEPILIVDGLKKNFGGLTAVDSVSFSVSKNEILGLIGPNGAGKTTCINMLSGIFRPTEGSAIFEGEEISSKKPHEIVERGLVRTFQTSLVFEDETVMENVIRSFHCQRKLKVKDAFFDSTERRERKSEIYEAANRNMEFVGLSGLKEEIAGNLPYGFQRLLQICIALGCQPKMLLLDEPSTGLNPKETLELMKIIEALRKRGISILLVAHDVKMVMTLANNIVVLNYGKKIAEGKPSEIKQNPQVIKAYLGDEDIEGSNVSS